MEKHNKNPSDAIDIATKPLDWNDRETIHLYCRITKRYVLY